MTFLNRQNVFKRWKVLWSDQFINYVLLFFIELQSCMSRYTGFEYNTTIILSIYWLFFREDCQWCNFVFINKYFPWKFKCFKNTSHKFLFICIQLWNKFGQIYIYYMKQLRKLTCCFLTIFFKTPVSSCFSKTSLIDTKYWTFVGTFENILKKISPSNRDPVTLPAAEPW